MISPTNLSVYDPSLLKLVVKGHRAYGFHAHKKFTYDSELNSYKFYIQATSGFNIILLNSSHTDVLVCAIYDDIEGNAVRSIIDAALPEIRGELTYKFIVDSTIPYYEYTVKGV